MGNLWLCPRAKKKPDLTRVGEGPWRHRSLKHYAIVWVGDKQIKCSLRTKNLGERSGLGLPLLACLIACVASGIVFKGSMGFKTEQEAFWSGPFGQAYTSRNTGSDFLRKGIAFWSQVLKHLMDVESAIEFGPNLGNNLRALQSLIPGVELSAVEINPEALNHLKQLNLKQIYAQSFLEFKTDYVRDLSFCCGVLIHIDPGHLQTAYEALYRVSRRYVLISEYYNPDPVSLPYRGHENKLFKRDFAGEMLDLYPDLKLVDYGFIYKRDKHSLASDSTWFLLEKS